MCFVFLKKDESNMETNDVIPGLRPRQRGRLTGLVCGWVLKLGGHLDSAWNGSFEASTFISGVSFDTLVNKWQMF